MSPALRCNGIRITNPCTWFQLDVSYQDPHCSVSTVASQLTMIITGKRTPPGTVHSCEWELNCPNTLQPIDFHSQTYPNIAMRQGSLVVSSTANAGGGVVPMIFDVQKATGASPNPFIFVYFRFSHQISPQFKRCDHDGSISVRIV